MHRTFLLGVGAQKAGTTWLYHALSLEDQVNFGATKEYHIWDALLSEAFHDFRVPQIISEHKTDIATIRYLMQNEKGYYSDYFKNIFDSGWCLTGDITPSYSCLSADDFRLVRNMLDDMGARIRVVFLMRDPFERNWSAVRMSKRIKGIPFEDEAMLLNWHLQWRNVARTRYDQTVSNLRMAFPEDELYFGIYETMHEERELRRLSDFLGVTINRSAPHQHHNVSPKLEVVCRETKSKIQAFYRDVYEFCWKEFPETREHWQV